MAPGGDHVGKGRQVLVGRQHLPGWVAERQEDRAGGRDEAGPGVGVQGHQAGDGLIGEQSDLIVTLDRRRVQAKAAKGQVEDPTLEQVGHSHQRQAMLWRVGLKREPAAFDQAPELAVGGRTGVIDEGHLVRRSDGGVINLTEDVQDLSSTFSAEWDAISGNLRERAHDATGDPGVFAGGSVQ